MVDAVALLLSRRPVCCIPHSTAGKAYVWRRRRSFSVACGALTTEGACEWPVREGEFGYGDAFRCARVLHFTQLLDTTPREVVSMDNVLL